ncbi:ThuA domain-containing protein [Hymenobacter gummosus]|uniref:ThuA domain-containing protein n=1 Tax=Hymenobacter gummosus TaxID=1776032 RepID=A0A3S0IKX0_9BACT|nr:ThuA domain-containing protein [Hymenobacter gummosus]RTQ46881.1 ThuA domain-containing protein [Hymenobacter gummosus]
MKFLASLLLAAAASAAGLIPAAPAGRPEAGALAPKFYPAVLVFHKTAGFQHSSIPAGLQAIRELGQAHKFNVESTADAGWFTPEKLSRYRAVVFLNTTQDVLDAGQQAAFEQYIRGGHGFVGVHAAADTEYDWPWYNGLVGAYFVSHPQIQPATVRRTKLRHRATSHLPTAWPRTDEWYNYRSPAPDLRVLLTVDEATYTGGTHGPDHPIAWYHPYDGGRAFYTGLGHTEESYADPLFRQHLWGGIKYAMGR